MIWVVTDSIELCVLSWGIVDEVLFYSWKQSNMGPSASCQPGVTDLRECSEPRGVSS